MKWDPADRKEEKNQKERSSCLHLSPHAGRGPDLSVTSAALLRCDAPHLLLNCDKDLGVDEEHDHQRSEHASKEIEIDHVGHVHHKDEETVARVRRRLVPAHQRHKSDEKCQNPCGEDHQHSVARRHQDLVSERHEDGDVALHSHCQQAEDGALGEHD